MTEYRLVVHTSNSTRPMRYPKRDRAAALKDMQPYLDESNYQGRRMPVVWIETRQVTKWVKL